MSGLVQFRDRRSKLQLQRSLIEIYHTSTDQAYQTLRFMHGRHAFALAFWDYQIVSWSPAMQAFAESQEIMERLVVVNGLEVSISSAVLQEPPSRQIHQAHDRTLSAIADMSVPGLALLLETAKVDKSFWPSIQVWCTENDAQDLEDIKENLDVIAEAVGLKKLTPNRIRRQAGWV